MSRRRTLVHCSSALILGAVLALAPRTATAVPGTRYSDLTFDAGLLREALVVGNNANAEVQRAEAWTIQLLRAIDSDAEDLAEEVDDNRNQARAARGKARKDALVRLRGTQAALRELDMFHDRVERVANEVKAALNAQSDADSLRALRKAGLRSCHPHLLSYNETHATWSRVLGALDVTALSRIDSIDALQQQLEQTPGAADVKPGRKALKLIGVIDRLSELAGANRTQITLADAVEQKLDYRTKPKSSDTRPAKAVKRPFKKYADYVVALDRLTEKIRSLVEQALAQAGGPVDDCPPTYPDNPDAGGGFIEVTVSTGGTRRYPAVAGVNLKDRRGFSGDIRVAAAIATTGSYDDDLVQLMLDAAALQGPGTYAAAVETDPFDGTKPRLIHDTRGPDGDPFPDNNATSFDYQRDILSGSVTITELDWDPANRVLAGTFTFVTEFGNNPEELRDGGVVTGSFRCCDFALFDESGAYSPPVR